MRKIFFFALLIVTVANVVAQVESAFLHNKELEYYYSLPRGYNNAENFQTNYPSFVLVPQSKGGWDVSKLITIVEKFKSTHPVDDKRIYLIGYSMGGSGSYILANGYYDYNHTLFAAIIRLAGQSQTTLRDSNALNSSIWLHIGLDDSPKRIDVTREAFDILHSVNEMDSNGFCKATGITSSRVPAGSCCRPLMQFARQAIPVCPTVSMSHCFSRQFLVINDLYYKISLFHLKKNVCPYIPHLKRAGFTSRRINS